MPARFRDETYRFYAAREVETLLVEAGLERVRVTPADDSAIVWVSGERADASV